MITGVIGISDILSQEIVFWKANLEAKSSNEITTKLLDSIIVFDDFRQKYVNFFLSDIDKIDLPADWFIFRVEQTLLEYWEPIKRAVNHYIHYPGLIELGSTALESYKAKLEITRDISAILYFDKVPRALRIPFGPIMFIGIPLTDAYRKDWKSIPHELGHQVFWNSQFTINDNPITSAQEASFQMSDQASGPMPDQASSPMPDQVSFQISDQMSDQTTNQTASVHTRESVFDSLLDKSINRKDWLPTQREKIKQTLNAWTEEIFAEFIGVKIAEADFVEAAWEKALSHIRKPGDAFYNDGKHPMPFLLPFIRKCANGEFINSEEYKKEFQKQIGQNKDQNEPGTNLMEAMRTLVGGLTASTITLKPIISSELDHFEQVSILFPDNDSKFENMLRPIIQEGTLTWGCGCGKNNDINMNICVTGQHSIPMGYKALRILLP